jgi:hypothetical protein
MWDLLITVGNLIIIPALLTTVLDKRAYIPRLSSGISLVGLVAVVAGMIGTGLVFSPIVVSIIGLFWVFIFFFRHQPSAPETTVVIPEIGVEVHTEAAEESTV